MIIDPYDFEKVILDSGLEVFLKKLDYASRVCFRLAINIGGVNGGHGLSHLVEHLIMKSIDNRVNIKETFDKYGASFDVYINNTHMVIAVDAPIGMEEYFLSLISEIIFMPRFSEKNLAVEKKIINNEINNSISVIENVMKEYELLKSCYNEKYHNFLWLFMKLGTLGLPEDVEKYTLEEIRNHYKKYFYPGNMKLLVVGNINKKKIKEKIKKYFKLQQKSLSKKGEIDFSFIIPSPIVKVLIKYSSDYPEPAMYNNNSVELLSFIDSQSYYCMVIFKKIFLKKSTDELRKKGKSYGLNGSLSVNKSYSLANFFCQSNSNPEFIQKLLIEQIEKIYYGKKIFVQEIKNELASLKTYNESSSAIANNAVSDIQKHNRIISNKEEVEIFRSLQFGDFQKAIDIFSQNLLISTLEVK